MLGTVVLRFCASRFQYPRPLRCPQLPTFQFASKRRQRLDDRVLLLFDINGVLMQHRWDGTHHLVRA